MSDWKYFSYETDPKLACSCCGKQGMNDDFMKKVDAIREDIKMPLVVVSGYRCPEYNAKVSSTGESGPHTTGRAIDLAADSQRRLLITAEALDNKITRIGPAKTFIHIDDLTEEDGFSQNVMWLY